MTDKKEFALPTSMEEAKQMRLYLIAEIQKIDVQLSAKGHSEDGTFQYGNPSDYYAWRHRAMFAKAKLTEKMRSVKEWIQAHYQVDIKRVTNEFLNLLVDMAIKHGGDLTELQNFIEQVANAEGKPDFVVPDLWEKKIQAVPDSRKS